jgi:thiosulfate dehydrogenase (quinone) large subunit
LSGAAAHTALTGHQPREGASQIESDVLLDRRLAFAFLRITLGLNILMHGAVRLPILSVFVAELVKEFAKTPLPAAVVKAFAYSLPFEQGLTSLLYCA